MASKKAKKGKQARRQAAGASPKSVSSAEVRQPLDQDQLQSGASSVLEAKSLYEAGKTVEALRLCLTILKEHGPNPEVLELAGRAAHANGQTAAAISLLEKALALDARRVPTLELLLEVAGEAGDKDRVERIARALSRLRSGDGQSSVDSDEEEALPAAELAVKTEKSEQVPEVLTKIFGLTSRLRVVDIGSNPIDGTPPYADLLKAGAVDLVGFEPQRDALAKLNKTKGPHEIYYPHAVGDGKPATLYLCRASGMTSTLKPNFGLLNHFHGYPQWAEIVGTETVLTVRLDDLEEVGSIDWLKIDIQGGELRVFEHGERRLADTLVIQTEVNFVPLYEGQPLFADIDAWMREHGFMLHALLEQRRRLYAPLQVNNQIHEGLNQLTTADAVYVPSLDRLEKLTADELGKLAIILHAAYGSHDLALRVLMIRDLKNKQNKAESFLVSLGLPPEEVEKELRKAKADLAAAAGNSERAVAGGNSSDCQMLQFSSSASSSVQSETERTDSSWLRKVLVFEPARGRGNHGGLNRHTSSLCEAARARGLDVKVVGNDVKEILVELLEASENRETAVYAGHFFFDLKVVGQQSVDLNIFDAIGLPVVALIDDHPYSIFMWERVQSCPRSAAITTFSPGVAKEFSALKGGGWPRLEVLPSPPPFVDTGSKLPNWDERDIDLLIPWGLHKLVYNGAVLTSDAWDALIKKSSNPSRDEDFIRRLSLKSQSDPTASLFELFVELYKEEFGGAYKFGTPWTGEDQRWLALLSSLDQELRLRQRHLMLSHLSGIPSNWNVVVTAPKEVAAHAGALSGRKNVTWAGVVTAEQLDVLYSRSKRVLNCNPVGADTVHERIKYAMAWGCLVVSDRNQALEKAFKGFPGVRLVAPDGTGVVDALTRNMKGQAEEAEESPRVVFDAFSLSNYYSSLFRFVENHGRPR